MEAWGYIKLRMTFSDDTSVRMYGLKREGGVNCLRKIFVNF